MNTSPSRTPTIEQTGACFTQKSEHTSLSPVFGRPRITIGGPLGFALEAAYLPPVTIAKAKPKSLQLCRLARASFCSPGRSRMERRSCCVAMARSETSKARSHVPISATAESASSPCYGTSPSKDTFHPDMFGGEIAASFAPGSGEFPSTLARAPTGSIHIFRLGLQTLMAASTTPRSSLKSL